MGWTTGVRIPAGAGILSLRYRVHAGPGAHPISYPMGTGAPFAGLRATGS
jgi:hypothetical protein